MNRIEIALCNLKNQKPTVVRNAYLELHDAYFRLVYDFDADEPKDRQDYELGWESVINSFDIYALKIHLCGVEKSWNNANKRWQLSLCLHGFQTDPAIFFRREEDATDLHQKLLLYLLSE